MKVTDNHLAELKAAIEPLDTPERRARYLRGDFLNADKIKDLDRRYRWDLLWESGVYHKLDARYYNDGHIDTALRAIVPALEEE